jgi:hypothetical protein
MKGPMWSRRPHTEWERRREEIRRNTAPHPRKSCGGCLGFYNTAGKLTRHPPEHPDQMRHR